MSLTPGYTPRVTLARVEKLAALPKYSADILPDDKVIVAMVRGYFEKTMGDPTRNDRRFYDDAAVIVAPDCFIAFNANVDPGAYREGIASLKEGVWRYRPGIHGLSKPKAQQYAAFVQAEEVVVFRDGTQIFEKGYRHPKYGLCEGKGYWRGWFGINQHKGGINSVSSLGCLTIPPAQWPRYHAELNAALKRLGQKTYPTILAPVADLPAAA